MKCSNTNDVKEMAHKLDEIKKTSPCDFHYLRGFIHCLLLKDKKIKISKDD